MKPEYLTILNDELVKRCQKNNKYSLRSFAKFLGVNPGGLSRILNGHIPLSVKMAYKIMSTIELEPNLQQQFLDSVLNNQKGRELKRTNPIVRAYDKSKYIKTEVDPQDAETYKLLSEWYHYAIIELIENGKFEDDPKWISSQLSISEIESKLAVQRLLELKVIDYDGKKYSKTNHNIDCDKEHIKEAAHRKLLRELREKSITSIENDSPETYNMTSISLCSDPKLFMQANQMILNFQKELKSFLQKGESSKVYNLNICLFPLQKIDEH